MNDAPETWLSRYLTLVLRDATPEQTRNTITILAGLLA